MNSEEQAYFWQEKLDNGHTRIGLTPAGQEEIGDAAFVDIDTDLKNITQGEPLLAVESSKAVTQLPAPVTAQVVQVHDDLLNQPELLNSSNHAKNWVIEIY